MKKACRQLAAAAVALCMSVGFAPRAGAYQWNTDGASMGEMVQYMNDEENGIYAAYIVQLLEVGSVVHFSQAVDVMIYDESHYGAYTPRVVAQGVSSYTIADTQHTYIFTGPEQERAVFRGVNTQQAPITLVSDPQGSVTLKLSEPVVDITTAPLETYDATAGEYKRVYSLIYEVPVGTQLTCKFGKDHIMLGQMWTPDGEQVFGADFPKLSAKHFPEGEVSAQTGGAVLPVSLEHEGYYYSFVSDDLAATLPVFKVVDRQAAEYTPRAAEFSDMDWSAAFVNKVYGYGWMDGEGQGKFAPGENLSVAQAITLAARLFSAQVNTPIPTCEGAWYESYLQYCQDNDLLRNFYNQYTQGESWLRAQLERPVTRLEMVKILSAAAKLPERDALQGQPVTIPDVDENSLPGGKLVYNWYRSGIISGDSENGAFRPNDGITRGETAVILCNLLEL